MATPPVLSPEQIEEAAMLYTEHEWTAADIGEHFDVSTDAVRAALKNKGVPMRSRGTTTQPQLRVKQCTNCLHFLPVALFATIPGRNGSPDRLASWCTPCTAHPRPEPLSINPVPLADAVSTWSRLQ